MSQLELGPPVVIDRTRQNTIVIVKLITNLVRRTHQLLGNEASRIHKQREVVLLSVAYAHRGFTLETNSAISDCL